MAHLDRSYRLTQNNTINKKALVGGKRIDDMTHASPRGPIPLIEPQWSHHEFVSAVQPDYVLCKLTSARQLLKRGETAASYFPPGTDVITTTTITDTKLNLISWEKEREIVEAFAPSYHIPTDYSTYQDQPPADRQANVERCLQGTLWMTQQMRDQDLDTTIIPLVKGCTPEEWAISSEVFDRSEFEYPMVAVFGTQYFTGGSGIRIDKLESDVHAIDSEQSRDIMLIGLLSPNYLERMPPAVRAATGLNQWRQPIAPRNQTNDEMQAIWTDLVDDVADALDQSDDPIDGVGGDESAPEQEVV